MASSGNNSIFGGHYGAVISLWRRRDSFLKIVWGCTGASCPVHLWRWERWGYMVVILRKTVGSTVSWFSTLRLSSDRAPERSGQDHTDHFHWRRSFCLAHLVNPVYGYADPADGITLLNAEIGPYLSATACLVYSLHGLLCIITEYMEYYHKIYEI